MLLRHDLRQAAETPAGNALGGLPDERHSRPCMRSRRTRSPASAPRSPCSLVRRFVARRAAALRQRRGRCRIEPGSRDRSGPDQDREDLRRGRFPRHGGLSERLLDFGRGARPHRLELRAGHRSHHRDPERRPPLRRQALGRRSAAGSRRAEDRCRGLAPFRPCQGRCRDRRHADSRLEQSLQRGHGRRTGQRAKRHGLGAHAIGRPPRRFRDALSRPDLRARRGHQQPRRRRAARW